MAWCLPCRHNQLRTKHKGKQNELERLRKQADPRKRRPKLERELEAAGTRAFEQVRSGLFKWPPGKWRLGDMAGAQWLRGCLGMFIGRWLLGSVLLLQQAAIF